MGWNIDASWKAVSHALEYWDHSGEWLPVGLVFREYCSFFLPVYLRLIDFVFVDVYMSSYLQLFVNLGSIMYRCNYVAGHTWFFAIGCIRVAFSRISVAVSRLIHSVEVPTGGCWCGEDLAVTTAVGGSQDYATTVRLGRCIDFVETLDNRMWTDCIESVPLPP